MIILSAAQTGSCSGENAAHPGFAPVPADYGQSYRIDSIGYCAGYDKQYKEAVRAIERCPGGFILQVAKSPSSDMEVGRLRRVQRQIVERKRDEPQIVIINKRAWDVNQCDKRVSTNPFDGDAKFVLGVYYLLTDKFQDAESNLRDYETSRFTVFSRVEMMELLGYAYFELGSKAKQNKKTGADFFMYLKKEQEIYLAASVLNNRMDEPFFLYLYAQTFLDLGNYLRENGDLIDISGIELPNAIRVRTSRQAYEQALKILLDFDRPSGHVHGSLSFIYEQLDMKEKALAERKLQGMAVKDSIYELLRRPIREKITGKLTLKTFFSDESIGRYVYLFEHRYGGEDRKRVQRKIDSLTFTLSKSVAGILVTRDPQTSALTLENRELLKEDVQKFVYKKIDDTLPALELRYFRRIIQTLSEERKFREALNQLDRYAGLFEKNDVYDEWLMLKNRLTEEYLRQQTKKLASVATQKESNASQVTYWDKDTMITLKSDDVRSQRKKERKEKQREDTVSTAQGEKSGIPVYENVNMLIDNLIRNKDYVSAYRGIKAYERVLKENLGSQDVSNKISQLEKIIKKDYGDKYFEMLKQEMKK